MFVKISSLKMHLFIWLIDLNIKESDSHLGKGVLKSEIVCNDGQKLSQSQARDSWSRPGGWHQYGS